MIFTRFAGGAGGGGASDPPGPLLHEHRAHVGRYVSGRGTPTSARRRHRRVDEALQQNCIRGRRLEQVGAAGLMDENYEAVEEEMREYV